LSSEAVRSTLADGGSGVYRLAVQSDDLQRARGLVEEALSICDAHGESLVAIKLQWALDTLPRNRRENRLREEAVPWRVSD
jgi:hypothetical protein